MNTLLTILGPTASGKTRLAVDAAMACKGEIISADSRQVFRAMDIGTGKDLDEYNRDGKTVSYHLIDIAEAGTEYSVFDFQKGFCNAWADVRSRDRLPILCGGTGMYLSSVLEKYSLTESGHNDALRSELDEMDMQGLRARLASHKDLHNSTDTEDRERLIRAIEIAESNAPPAVDLPDFKACIIGIELPRKELHTRIEARLKQRLKNGMLEEVNALLETVSHEQLEKYGLEYRFLSQHIRGELRYNDMQQKLRSAIINFAKRQLTWFRRMERNGLPIHWIDGMASPTTQLESILLTLQTH